MFNSINKFIYRYLSDSEALFIFVALVIVIAILSFMGHVMIPIIASTIIAYMLNGFIKRLEKLHFPSLAAISLVYLLFLSIFLIIFIWLLPLLLQQLGSMFEEIPSMLNKGQTFLIAFQQHHPEFFSTDQINRSLADMGHYLTQYGHYILSFSLTSIGNIITAVVYLILVPLLVFFLLKDSRRITKWLTKFLPEKHFVISTLNSLGGKNEFLGISYISVGVICLIMSILFYFGYKSHKKIS